MADWFDDKRRNPFFFGPEALNNPAPRNWLDDLGKRPSFYDSDPLFGALSPPSLPIEKNSLAGLFALSPPQPTPRLPVDRNALGGLFGLATPSTFFGSLAPSPQSILPRPAAAPAPTKRKGFFSFHWDDLLRVNNVRNTWNIDHPDRKVMRNFYDRSLWESTKLRNPEALKNLIRRGMEHSSTLCVLVGTHTWERRWVKYEIARSVVDRKGLLAIHINGLKHHQRQQPDALGLNPLHLMGVYKSLEGKFYIYENRLVMNSYTGRTEWQWHPYTEYTLAVRLPKYLAEPPVGHVRPLATGAHEYDHVADIGHKNLGEWIDLAAIRAGR